MKMKSSALRTVTAIVLSMAAAGAVQAQSLGVFSFVSMTRTMPGSTGDTATVTLKNTGLTTITGISHRCSSLSWYTFGSSQGPVAPGQTFQVQCKTAASGAYGAPKVTVTGTALNSPYVIN